MNNWTKEWNDVIRYSFFADTELKTLMKLPANTTIIDFIDNYFIRGGASGKLLTNQAVRIVYGTVNPTPAGSPNVTKNTMSFDIYVRHEDMHNVSNDRLEMRTCAIADRIKTILTHNRYITPLYRFWYTGEQDLATSTIGYSRYCVTFDYMRVV